MFNYMISVLYNSSILIPFIFSIGVVEFIKNNVKTSIFVLLISLLMFLIQVYIKKIALKKLNPHSINVTNLTRDENSKISALYISYFVPFLQLISGNQISRFTVIIVIVGVILVIASHKGLENPIFKVLGYKTFQVETAHGVDYILLSKREIRDIKTIKKVVRLTENRLLEV